MLHEGLRMHECRGCVQPLIYLPVLVFCVRRLNNAALKYALTRRDAELVKQNIVQLENGEVRSTCGTHLGHNLAGNDSLSFFLQRRHWCDS